MAHRRFQKGYVYQRGAIWYGRWREDVIRAESKVVRVQKNQARGTLKEYRTKRLAQRAKQSGLFRVNDPGYRPGKLGTLGRVRKADILARRGQQVVPQVAT